MERLFVEQGGVLNAFLGRRVRRQPDAADLAQEVYVRMLRVPNMEAIRSPQAYLFTVANNLAKEHARDGFEERHALDVQDPQIGIVKDDWSVQMYGQNLTDVRAQLFANYNNFVKAVTVNPPRTIGLRVIYKIGGF